MRILLDLDAHDYDPALPSIDRTAVRGVIFREGRLLMIQSSFGEVKFPGGGQEAGESDLDTLLREVLEETGYHVQPDSVQPLGEVVEKRLSRHEPMIWHQINRYYLCRIEGEQEACRYSQNEQRYGMHQVWLPLSEAVEVNRQMLTREGCNPWNQRETRVLEWLTEQVEAGLLVP